MSYLQAFIIGKEMVKLPGVMLIPGWLLKAYV